MKPVHIPRFLIIFFLILVFVTFLVATLQTFGSVHASTLATPTPTAIVTEENDANLTPAPEPTPIPTPVLKSADTTGIIALAVIIVIIVLVGVILGGSRPGKKKVP